MTFEDPTTVTNRAKTEVDNNNVETESTSGNKFDNAPTEIIWNIVVQMILWHLAALYGMYLVLTDFRWKVIVLAIILLICNGISVTAGAHRLYSHRSYKAKWPMRLWIMFFQTMSMQMSLYTWARMHRLHHKFTETNADPHSINRGFFFAHIGWTVTKYHPEFLEKEKTINLSDLWEDPIVRFQYRFYYPLALIIWLYIPTVLPHYLFGDPISYCFFVNTMLRFIIQLHGMFLINSVAHVYGDKPYNKQLNACENKWTGVPMGITGEGYHNYHHTFPWDYSASEFGWNFNLSTMFIDCCAKMGLAYDLKTTDKNLVMTSKLKSGDGSLK